MYCSYVVGKVYPVKAEWLGGCYITELQLQYPYWYKNKYIMINDDILNIGTEPSGPPGIKNIKTRSPEIFC